MDRRKPTGDAPTLTCEGGLASSATLTCEGELASSATLIIRLTSRVGQLLYYFEAEAGRFRAEARTWRAAHSWGALSKAKPEAMDGR